jgi:outer membrane protein TolC
MRLTTFIIVLLSWRSIYSQDTAYTFSHFQLLESLRKYHPVIRQSQIDIEKSQAAIRFARGGFDPTIQTYVTDKTFNGTKYYNEVAVNVTIPAWYGITVEAGTDNLTGERIDPMLTQDKSSFVGVTVPLIKDLVLDKRRAALKQAKLFKETAEVEQRAIINDVFMNALEAYWQWAYNYRAYEVMRQNVIVNKQRLTMVRQSFSNGERAAIDTIEALAQMQNFEMLAQSYWLQAQNAKLLISAFLWYDKDEPYQLPERVTPPIDWENNEFPLYAYDIPLDTLLQLATQHPELLLYDYKLDVLDIDRKLKFQDMLPKLDFSYYQLGKGYNFINTISEGPIFRDNYQYAFKFQMPLTFSQGRSNYKQTLLKIEETSLDQSLKQYNIALKVQSYYNEFVTLRKQLQIHGSATENYEKLLRAEEKRFSNGESSLFLINSRENKYLEAQQKLIELKAKFCKAVYALQWSAGLLE